MVRPIDYSNQLLINTVRAQAQSGHYLFIRFDQIKDSCTEKDAVKIGRLEQIDQLFLSTHAMIEKAALQQSDRTTCFELTNLGWRTEIKPLSIGDSIKWVNAQRVRPILEPQTLRVYKITLYRERGPFSRSL